MAKVLIHKLCVLLLALSFLAAPGAAQAKLIAIVFDTSGSMSNRYNLPTFGMQLLTSTIDGRAGEDRVWALNFNAYSSICAGFIPEAATLSGSPCNLTGEINKFNITSDQTHASMLESLQITFAASKAGTPYGPLEVMLTEISNNMEEGEEVILIVVTDGAYEVQKTKPIVTEFDNSKYVPQFKRSFAEYRKRILAKKGSLRAEFLFIDTDTTGETEDLVAEQGVRDTLLGTFNGDPKDGAWHVRSADALLSAINDITARINDTDRKAQNEFITFSGSEIVVDSPLSITRIVSITTTDGGAHAPEITTQFQSSDERSLKRNMTNGDTLYGGKRLNGIVEHRFFVEPVPPGELRISFDKPVDKETTFLLFETGAVAELKIFDDTGSEVLADQSNEYRLFTGKSYTFKTSLLDGDNPPAIVDLSVFKSEPSMFLSLEGPSINQTRSMTIDSAQNAGNFEWTPSKSDSVIASSRVSAGILSPASKALNLKIINSLAAITVSKITSTIACADCSDAEVLSRVSAPGGADVEVGTFEVSAQSEIPGAILVSLEDVPDGYRIVDENNQPVLPDVAIAFEPGSTKTFKIIRPGDVDLPTLSKGGVDIRVAVTPTGAWTGPPAKKPTRVRLTPPGMEMRLTSVTQKIGATPADGLLVPGGELLGGTFGGKFSLNDLLRAPDNAEVNTLVDVQTSVFSSRLIGFTPSFPNTSTGGAHVLDVRASTQYWCLCFLGINNMLRDSDAYQSTVRYTHKAGGVTLQSAEAALPLMIPIGNTQMSLSCLLNLFYLLLFVMFLRGIYALVTTHRFPKGAVLEIIDGTAIPRFKRLDKGNSVWWRAWLSLFTGNPNETRTVEGLKIEATRKGAVVDVSKSTPPWEVERLGESFTELKETNRKKTLYTLIYGDRLENIYKRSLEMRLLRKSSGN